MHLRHVCSVDVFSLPAAQQQIADSLLRVCSRQHGFCVAVKQIVIRSARASPRGTLICDADCLVEFFMPREGQTLEAVVEKYIPDKGLFCKHRMHIVVPARLLPPGAAFNPGDRVRVTLQKVRYQSGSYGGVAILSL